MRKSEFFSERLSALNQEVIEEFSEIRKKYPVIDFTEDFELDYSPTKDVHAVVNEMDERDLWDWMPSVEIRTNHDHKPEEAEVLLINEDGILVIIDRDPEYTQYINFTDLSDTRDRISLLDDIETLLRLT